MPAWLPQTGLIRDYHDYATTCTDAPPIYHAASMLTSIASVVGDTSELIVDNHPFPLHVWMMMIGASTTDRKTTATRMAVQRVENIVPDRIGRIYGSPEGLLKELAAHPCQAIYVPEGGAFFAQREASYWKHAKDLFMDLYDYTKVFEKKLVKETIRIENPRVSLLAACALPLLERYTRDTDWLGGFLARFMLVSGEPMPFKDRMRSDPHTEKFIETQLNNVFRKKWGALSLTTAARTILDDFSFEIHTDQVLFPEGLQPSLNRLPETAHRTAALYEIARHASAPPASGVVLVTAESAACAVGLCRASRDNALTRVAGLTEKPGFSRDLGRLETLIRRASIGGIGRTPLIRKMRLPAADLDKLLNTLFEADLIKYNIVQGKTRPTHKYVHEQAQADLAREQTARAAHPTGGGTAYVNLDLGTVEIGSLPLRQPPKPGEIVVDDEDAPGWN